MSAVVPTVPSAPPSARTIRAWVVPGLLALVVGELVLVTSLTRFALSAIPGLWVPAGWLLQADEVVVYGLFAVCGAASILGVALARRHPRLAVTLAALPFATVPLTGAFETAWLVAVMLTAALLAYDASRLSAVPLAVGFMTTVAGSLGVAYPLMPESLASRGSVIEWGRSAHPGALVVGLFVIAAVVGGSATAGAAWRSRRRNSQAADLMRRATEVESAAAERARLARDLHDVVAHHISLVVARADGAPFQYPGIDNDARSVLRAIGDDARGALGELRQVLAVLRRSEDADPTARAPQPTAADTLTLVEQAREAGQQVTVADGTADVVAHLPAPVGYALYRAAQESLTNARRHAPNQPVELAFTRAGDVAGLAVSNPVILGAPHGRDDLAGTGRGLIGMRERVEALGGALAVGSSDGVFRVVATIPVRREAVTAR